MSTPTLYVNGNISCSGSIDSTGTGFTDLIISGNATIGGTLGVTGATTLTDVTSTGAANLNNCSVANALEVLGAASLAANATVGGELSVTGLTILNELDVNVTGTLEALVCNTNATIGGTLAVDGTLTAGGSLGANDITTGNLNVNATATFDGPTLVNQPMTVAGTATFDGITLVNGDVTTEGTFTVNGSILVTEGLTLPTALVQLGNLSGLGSVVNYTADLAPVTSGVPIIGALIATLPPGVFLVCGNLNIINQGGELIYAQGGLTTTPTSPLTQIGPIVGKNFYGPTGDQLTATPFPVPTNTGVYLPDYGETLNITFTLAIEVPTDIYWQTTYYYTGAGPDANPVISIIRIA